MSALKTQTVPALDRALSIMELLSRSRAGLSLPEIVEQCGLPRSTVHYLVVTLERRGYLQKNERTGRYLFGTSLATLANAALSGLSLRQKSAPQLQSLMHRTRLTVHMGILSDREVTLVAKHDVVQGCRVATWIGKRMHVHCTAVGKAIAAYLAEDELDRIIRDHGLPRHNEHTIASPQKLRAELAKVALLGYAVDNEEEELGSRCLGVPVMDGAGQVVAAVSLAGTCTEIHEANSEALLRQLKATARALSLALAEPVSRAC